MPIERSFIISSAWDASVNDDILPLSVLEELEHGKSFLDSVVVNQILEELWIGGKAEEGSKEPTITKNTLLDITRLQSVLHHHWFILSINLLRTKP